MNGPTLLIVKSEESFRRLAAAELARWGYEIETTSDVADARARLAKRRYDAVVIGSRLADGSGLDLLDEVKNRSPFTEVVVLASSGAVSDVVRAMKHGALDVLAEPHLPADVAASLAGAGLKGGPKAPHATAIPTMDPTESADGLVGGSAAIRRLRELIRRVAVTDSTVLIQGESGVGKEIVARAVHARSRRAQHPLIIVDCASLHENLLQSELFGHERGAYTGAVRLKQGLFELADRATIFLDEIAELTPALQVKLLRVLETGSFRRVGGTADLNVDARVIAATSRPLEDMMRDGRFREDLFYRLNVFALVAPPLREHLEDLPLLVEHVIHRKAEAGSAATMTAAAMDILRHSSWPGNVRELENVIERALILSRGEDIQPEHLLISSLARAPGVEGEQGVEDEGPTAPLEEVERRYIERTLTSCRGHRRKAANLLRISERTLYRKLKQQRELSAP